MKTLMTREELGIEINWAGGWHEYFQTKYYNPTLEAYWKERHTKLRKEYDERFLSD